MTNPGYVMVDFTGVDVSGNSVTINGITKRAKEALNSGKPCYACNLMKGGNYISPMPVTVYMETIYVMFSGTFTLKVGPSNNVAVVS